ncbi:HNH endonuclease signature motif containing protein [Planctomonas psychrotolerans]|uniref:HNH endonuclease signature motif containing protein n=1 Tax=Planctomonas psychrotolerans TaxID=2528712 RepID=UPI001239B7BA|nr:HNH endonuclease signature motif containing protein [Planctomonas psychrotolerans]
MELLSTRLRTAADTVAVLGDCAADVAVPQDGELRGAQDRVTVLRQCVDRYAALIAGEIAHRSRPEAGHGGMAQSAGFVSPEAMIQSIGKLSRPEAVKLVQLGTIIAETEAAVTLTARSVEAGAGSADGEDTSAEAGTSNAQMPPPWQAPLVAALADGTLSSDCFHAIQRALGDVGPGVPATALTTACEELLEAAAGLSPDQLFRKARNLRDELDRDGIARREKQRRDDRTLRTWWDSAGMYCGKFRLAPEEGTIVAGAIDQILSPRRGGPRMVDPEEKAAADTLLNDERSTEQIAADALVEMIRLAVDADPGTIFRTHRPAVRVIITDAHLHNRAGHGRIEGHPDPVSFRTVERHLCDTGAIAVGFDDTGQCVNVGRARRFFTPRQRVGMAVRDGGCRFPSCDRPPSWGEAHHINPWKKEHGKTDIADGVLLCRRHHLLLHDNHWKILRHDGDYWLRPPQTVDPTQTLLPMPSRNPDIHTIQTQHQTQRQRT